MESSTNSLQISNERKVQLLTTLLDKSKEITKPSCAEPIFKEWNFQVIKTLTNIFGKDSLELKEYKKLVFKSNAYDFSITHEDAFQHVETFNRDFDTAIRLINQCIVSVNDEANFIFSLSPSPEIRNKSSIDNLTKIQWLGTQKQLGELFIELKRKDWIKEIEPNLIQQYFSDANTIKQVLKPSNDKEGIANYEGVYTKSYKPKFDSIKPNENI